MGIFDALPDRGLSVALLVWLRAVSFLSPLALAPWESTMETPEERRVSWEVYARAVAGRPVAVRTKPGRLGFRWAWVE